MIVAQDATGPHKRRNLRFSLRTLLVLVSLSALGTWMYLEGWPRLVVAWQEKQFESGARQLKVGSVPLTGMQLVPGKNPINTTYTSNSSGQLIGMTKYVWPNAVYCIYYTFPRGYSGAMMQAGCESVAVYRLPPIPVGYVSQSEAGRVDSHQADGKPGGAAVQRDAYFRDILDVLSGNISETPALNFELIHADPSPKTSDSPGSHLEPNEETR